MNIRVNASILHLLICYTLIYHLCHITPRHSSLLRCLLLWHRLLVLHLRLSHLHLLYWLLPLWLLHLLLHTIPYTCWNCLNLLHYRLWLLPVLLYRLLILHLFICYILVYHLRHISPRHSPLRLRCLLLWHRLWLNLLLVLHLWLLYRLMVVIMSTSTVLTVLVLYWMTTIHHLS